MDPGRSCQKALLPVTEHQSLPAPCLLKPAPGARCNRGVSSSLATHVLASSHIYAGLPAPVQVTQAEPPLIPEHSFSSLSTNPRSATPFLQQRCLQKFKNVHKMQLGFTYYYWVTVFASSAPTHRLFLLANNASEVWISN